VKFSSSMKTGYGNDLKLTMPARYRNPPDDTNIIEGKPVDYKGHLAMSRPMRAFDYIGSNSSANRSYCWACLHPGWMDHDIRDCVQAPCSGSTVSVMGAAAACRSNFAYPKGSDVHVACGAPCYLGCADRSCLCRLIACSVYVAATGKASHLHHEAQKTFSKRYNVDVENIRPEELITVMARPHGVASRTVSALIWFIELIHDSAEASFQLYSQYGL
jgi:hypothetical protein